MIEDNFENLEDLIDNIDRQILKDSKDENLFSEPSPLDSLIKSSNFDSFAAENKKSIEYSKNALDEIYRSQGLFGMNIIKEDVKNENSLSATRSCGQ